jgi:hypothetical protein
VRKLLALARSIIPRSENSSRLKNSPRSSLRSTSHWREYTSAADTAA